MKLELLKSDKQRLKFERELKAQTDVQLKDAREGAMKGARSDFDHKLKQMRADFDTLLKNKDTELQLQREELTQLQQVKEKDSRLLKQINQNQAT